jgi:hypothetical protein
MTIITAVLVPLTWIKFFIPVAVITYDLRGPLESEAVLQSAGHKSLVREMTSPSTALAAVTM